MDDDFAKLHEMLLGLRGDKMRKIQRKALQRAGDLMAEEIRMRAPIKPEGAGGVMERGELIQRIKARVSAPDDEGVVAGKATRVVIGPKGKSSKLVTSDVEYGHTKRKSTGTKGPAGFTSAHPFIRPAFDTKKDAMVEEYRAVVAEEIKKAVK
jgi:hypothetical protein